MSEIFPDELYWTALGAGSLENFTVGFVILVIKTAVMVLCSQHSSSLVAHFVVFFASWCFPHGKHGFLHGTLVFPASFAVEKADKETLDLLQFSRIKRVKLDELSFIVQLFNYLFCQRLHMGCQSYNVSIFC